MKNSAINQPIGLVFLLLIIAGTGLYANPADNVATMDNPLLQPFDTPFETPPFDRIKTEHFLPAFTAAVEAHNREINAIADNSQPASFANTVEALDYSGVLLKRVSSVFFCLLSAHTNDQLQSAAREIAPRLSEHQDSILQNRSLFKRIKEIFDKRDSLKLGSEQQTLLEKTYLDFLRGGANLPAEKKERLSKINQRLSVLSLNFGENILKETNKFKLLLEKKDLDGLPQGVIAAAAAAARESGHAGKWVITLHKPSWIPFLQYSTRRDLREKVFKAFINMGGNGDELDTREIITQIVNLRIQRANLLGYTTHADYMLEDNMAKTPARVYDLLKKLWVPARQKALQEAAQMQELIDAEKTERYPLKPWDWWFYAEKVKKARYDLEESELRPYFQLENVRNGAFTVASRLFGIQFTERDDLPKYHDDVRSFEVQEEDGSHIGILYVDYFPRASKRGGAWMNNLRAQYRRKGESVTPLVYNVGNFSKPTGDTPSLLSLDEVLTLFHEFGHALHGLLSDCTYPRLSGTNVPIDFVELPSQIMEHWALHPDVLALYARHYKTGEPIPAQLIEKIKQSGHFNQGFATVEYLASAILDMDYHILEEPLATDPVMFERTSMDRIDLIPQIVPRWRSTYFRHIFSGGYSAGYYSYIWSAVLDADAFEAFKQNGIFDRETGMRYRTHILASGGTEEAMTLYKRFRGSEPDIEPLLRKRGLVRMKEKSPKHTH